MEHQSQCDLCQSNESKVIHDLRNLRFIPGPIVQCTGCGLKYRSVSLTEKELSAYYQKEEYGEESYLRDYSKDYLKHLPKSEILVYNDVLRLLEKQVTVKGKLLEIGCASGILLDIARKRGWEVMGVEVSPSMAEAARKNFGIPVTTGQIETTLLPEEYFDAIVLWDVIEHFLSPARVMKKVNTLLKPGGTVVVFTQDNNSFLVWLGELFAKLGIRNFLYHLFDNYHLFFYTSKTLRNFLEKHNFDVVRIKHYKAEVSKRVWSDISIGSVLTAGTTIANTIAHLIRRDYRMVFFAKKSECK